MRLLAIAAILALGACAGEESSPVWYRSDGKPVGGAEMRSALLACDAQMTVPVPVTALQVPVAVARDGTWMHRDDLHYYEQLEDSPAFARLSAPEIDACLRSYGYRDEQSTRSGSSAPPASQ